MKVGSKGKFTWKCKYNIPSIEDTMKAVLMAVQAWSVHQKIRNTSSNGSKTALQSLKNPRTNNN